MAAFGLAPAAPLEPPTLDVWPDNWTALCLFAELRTQWTLTPNGRLYGLRYEVLPMMLRLHAVPRAQHVGVMQDIRILESATLEIANQDP